MKSYGEKNSCTPKERLPSPEVASPKKFAGISQATWHTSPLFNLPKEEGEEDIIAAHVPTSWKKETEVAMATTTFTSAKSHRVSFQDSEIEQINDKARLTFPGNISSVILSKALEQKQAECKFQNANSPHQRDTSPAGQHSFSDFPPTEHARARALAALADISSDEESAIATKFAVNNQPSLVEPPLPRTAIHVFARGKEDVDADIEETLHVLNDFQNQRKDKTEVDGMQRTDEDDLIAEQNKDLLEERNSLLLAIASPKVSSMKNNVTSTEEDMAMKQEAEANRATKMELERAELAGEIARLMESYSSLGDSYNSPSLMEDRDLSRPRAALQRGRKPKSAGKPTKLVCPEVVSPLSDDEDKRGFSPLFAGTLRLRRERLPDWKGE